MRLWNRQLFSPAVNRPSGGKKNHFPYAEPDGLFQQLYRSDQIRFDVKNRIVVGRLWQGRGNQMKTDLAVTDHLRKIGFAREITVKCLQVFMRRAGAVHHHNARPIEYPYAITLRE